MLIGNCGATLNREKTIMNNHAMARSGFAGLAVDQSIITGKRMQKVGTLINAN